MVYYTFTNIPRKVIGRIKKMQILEAKKAQEVTKQVENAIRLALTMLPFSEQQPYEIKSTQHTVKGNYIHISIIYTVGTQRKSFNVACSSDGLRAVSFETSNVRP